MRGAFHAYSRIVKAAHDWGSLGSYFGIVWLASLAWALTAKYAGEGVHFWTPFGGGAISVPQRLAPVASDSVNQRPLIGLGEAQPPYVSSARTCQESSP